MNTSQVHKIFFFFSFIFIILTNNFFSYEETIIYGATDGATYFQIANKAPNFLETEVPYHKAQRFIFPYLIGLISNFTEIKVFYIFKIFSIIILICNFFLLAKFLNCLEAKKNEQFFLLSLFIFNPYITRYFLAMPTMINDLIFIFSGTIFLFSFVKKNFYLLTSSIILASSARIESIYFVFAIILGKLFYKKNFNWNNMNILCCVGIISVISYINYYHANIAGLESQEAYTLKVRFGLFFFNYSLKEFLIFLFIPLLNFLPLIFIPILFEFKIFKILNNKILIISIMIIFFIIATSMAAGPATAGKNIIRLINLTYPFIIFCIFNFLREKKLIFSKKLIFIIFLFLWSLHPTYSNINVFLPLSKIFSY